MQLGLQVRVKYLINSAPTLSLDNFEKGLTSLNIHHGVGSDPAALNTSRIESKKIQRDKVCGMNSFGFILILI
jgi:hypothetical protein